LKRFVYYIIVLLWWHVDLIIKIKSSKLDICMWKYACVTTEIIALIKTNLQLFEIVRTAYSYTATVGKEFSFLYTRFVYLWVVVHGKVPTKKIVYTLYYHTVSKKKKLTKNVQYFLTLIWGETLSMREA